jgi:hypothetical protein
MRPILLLSLLATAAGVAASPALAQAPDRYGGYGSYPSPAQPQAAPTPGRVLTWPGKTLPAAPQAAGPVDPRYGQPQPAAGPQLQPPPYAQVQGPAYANTPASYRQPAPQGYAPAQSYRPQPQQRPPQAGQAATYPSGLRAQPYYAPAPVAPPPATGSTATAPSGVYPANTVPPNIAYPQAVPPQMAAPLVGPSQPLPTSIYSPPPAAAATQTVANPGQPQRVAMNTAASAQSARLYSVHRAFGMQPDPTPAAPAPGEAVELVTPIDSGGAPNPAADDDRPRVRQTTTANGKTVTQMRGSSSPSDN